MLLTGNTTVIGGIDADKVISVKNSLMYNLRQDMYNFFTKKESG